MNVASKVKSCLSMLKSGLGVTKPKSPIVRPIHKGLRTNRKNASSLCLNPIESILPSILNPHAWVKNCVYTTEDNGLITPNPSFKTRNESTSKFAKI